MVRLEKVPFNFLGEATGKDKTTWALCLGASREALDFK